MVWMKWINTQFDSWWCKVCNCRHVSASLHLHVKTRPAGNLTKGDRKQVVSSHTNLNGFWHRETCVLKKWIVAVRSSKRCLMVLKKWQIIGRTGAKDGQKSHRVPETGLSDCKERVQKKMMEEQREERAMRRKEGWNHACLCLIYCLWQGSGPSSRVSMT